MEKKARLDRGSGSKVLTFLTRQMFGYKRQRNIDIFTAVPLEAREGNKYILTLIMKAIVSCFLKKLITIMFLDFEKRQSPSIFAIDHRQQTLYL